MAIGYARFSMFWGAIDLRLGGGSTTSVPYGSAQVASGGASAVAGSGVGVRRAVMIFDRTAQHAGADDAECHFDFLNMTSSAPDDTWTSTDFSSLETRLQTLWTTFKVINPAGVKLREIRWYRVGSGIAPPNPAVRVNTLATPVAGTAAAATCPPQVACSVTFRTALRKNWGRTYMPASAPTLDADGTLGDSLTDSLATAVGALVTGAATDDFILGVTSHTLNAFLAAEAVEVDDNLDVIRRRRWKSANHRKIINT